jgi:beta-1,4-mannosyl-glycoprotein beta-1,4-N-acetylglucosaminyltransferase
MKIYDSFTFFNELDLLELRLEELYDHVDHFVLVEANRTFQNNPKPFYFGENQYRFAKYMDKVIHIQVNDMPEHTDPWGRERYQRDGIPLAPALVADLNALAVELGIASLPHGELA